MRNKYANITLWSAENTLRYSAAAHNMFVAHNMLILIIKDTFWKRQIQIEPLHKKESKGQLDKKL